MATKHSTLTKCNMEIKGSLAKDPVVRYAPGGTAICEFSLVFNPFSTKDPRNKPVWLNCIAFKKLAEDIGLNFKRGTRIHVTKATPKVDEWRDKDGNPRASWVWSVWEAEGVDEPEFDDLGDEPEGGYGDRDDEIPL